MKIRLNPEDGFKSPDSGVGDARVPSAPLGASSSKEAAKAAILETIQRAMDGTLDAPAGTELVIEKLNETHIQIVIERALSNQTLEELGEKYHLHPVYVGVICRHPFAQRLIAQITGKMADSIDDVQERIAATAAEALEIKVMLMRTSQFDAVRDRIASDLLDRAGYGARRQLDVNNTVHETHTLRVEGEQSSHLARVLAESMCVASVDYRQHLAARPQVQRDEDSGAMGDFGIAQSRARILPGDGLPQAADGGGVSHAPEGLSASSSLDDDEEAA